MNLGQSDNPMVAMEGHTNPQSPHDANGKLKVIMRSNQTNPNYGIFYKITSPDS